MNKVIVLGTDHYNTLWLVRSLGMAGFRPFVIILSSKEQSFVVKSRYCNGFIIKNSCDSIIYFLLSRNVVKKEVLFTSSDGLAKLLDQNYNLLVKKYIIQGCHKEGELSFWMNKDKMLAKAAECGLKIPITYSLYTERKNDLGKIKYPCLVKPELSAEASKNNFRICYNQDELNKAIQEVKCNCTKILVQEYIKSDFEYLVYGVSTDDEICLPGGLRKIHTCSSTNNLGMMSYAFLSNEIPSQIDNFDRIKKFIQSIEYKGLFSVEFMITKDEAYFLEINLRNDGTCYITTQAGVNMPSLWAANVLGLDTSNLRKTLIRPRTFGMNEVNYIKYTLKSQSIITSFKELLRVKAFSLCKWDDMQPVIAKILFGIQNLYKKV